MTWIPWKGEQVSTAVMDKATSWTRSDEQERIVADYLARVQRQYADAGADPLLVDVLKDPTIVGTEQIVEFFGYVAKTRVFILYRDAYALEKALQTPHPSAIVSPDAYRGKRGPHQVRGIMLGRLVWWALQSGRYRWDSVNKQLRPRKLNAGGAPKQRR